MLMQYSFRTLILILIGLLLFWSVMDYGGRYLHVQALAQVISGGILLLLVLEQIRHPRLRWMNNYPVFLPACFWFVAWALAWVFSVNRLASLEELLRLLMYLSLPAVLFVMIKQHVLLEKPISTSWDTTEKFAAEVQNYPHLKVMMGMARRCRCSSIVNPSDLRRVLIEFQSTTHIAMQKPESNKAS